MDMFCISKFIAYVATEEGKAIFSILTLMSATAIGVLQFLINKKMHDSADVVELYAFPEHYNISGQAPSSYSIVLNNVGTKIVYLNAIVLPGETKQLDMQVMPPSVRAGSTFYRINPDQTLPQYEFEIHFCDESGKRWKSNGSVSTNGVFKEINLKRRVELTS